MQDASPTEQQVVMSEALSEKFLSDRQQQLMMLIEELEQLTHDAAESVAAVTLDQTKVGRLSRMDALQGQAMAKATDRRREQTIALARVALNRLATGNYGDCVECGEWINPRRLEMDPMVSLCIGCAQEAETSN